MQDDAKTTYRRPLAGDAGDKGFLATTMLLYLVA